jgi:hypothetical protein
MAIIVSNIMELRHLDLITDNYPSPIMVALFSNNMTPGPATVDGDFTELVAGGYARQNPLPWSIVATDAEGMAVQVSNTVTYNITSPGPFTVYGWYLVEGTSVVWLCERFATPVTVGSGQPALSFQIRLRLRELVGG